MRVFGDFNCFPDYAVMVAADVGYDIELQP
jgi:hypothetical protein